MVRVGNYYLGEVIGTGAYSQVKMARHHRTGERFVAKIVPREGGHSANLETVKREITILRKVRHANVVRLVELLLSDNNFYIILEPVLGGDLCSLLLNKYQQGMPRGVARRLFTQLVSGLAQCHGVGVAHRDLKPENLLINDEGTLKISDFGLSRLHPESQVEAAPNEFSETVAGTLAYLAPEQLEGPYDAFRADMWSAGCILYTMVTGRFPFGSDVGYALERRILETPYDPLPATVDRDVAELIDGLLTKDPRRRLTLPEVAAHPFVAGDSSDDAEGENSGTFQLVTEVASPKHGATSVSTAATGANSPASGGRPSGCASSAHSPTATSHSSMRLMNAAAEYSHEHGSPAAPAAMREMRTTGGAPSLTLGLAKTSAAHGACRLELRQRELAGGAMESYDTDEEE